MELCRGEGPGKSCVEVTTGTRGCRLRELMSARFVGARSGNEGLCSYAKAGELGGANERGSGADGSLRQGFFCQLPFDPARTEIGACAWGGELGEPRRGADDMCLGAECQRIEKIVERTR